MESCKICARPLAFLSRNNMKLRSPKSSGRQIRGNVMETCFERRSVACKVSNQDAEVEAAEDQQTGGLALGATIGNLGVLCGLIGYVAFLAPNQSPLQDQYFISKIVGLAGDDGYQVNRVFTDLFLIMGVPPAIYAALLIPAGRSKNKIPAWPFIVGSFALGCFALLPYFSLWQPAKDIEVPPKPESMEGLSKPFLQFQESRIYGILFGVSALFLFGDAALAGDGSWKEFLRLFETSRLVHVTTLDFLTLNLLIPFWLMNDASERSWDQKDRIGAILQFIPLIGPAIYLALRPNASSMEE